MGRPFLYSLTYGEEGVVHAIESKSQSIIFTLPSLFWSDRPDRTCHSRSSSGLKLERETMAIYWSELISVMRDEIATTMRLLGVTRLDQLGPHLVSLLIPPRIFHLPLSKCFPLLSTSSRLF